MLRHENTVQKLFTQIRTQLGLNYYFQNFDWSETRLKIVWLVNMTGENLKIILSTANGLSFLSKKCKSMLLPY